MRFSDEQLSAFLDSELPESEMRALRNALAADERLADRLAELALVDTLVAENGRVMDAMPVPQAVAQLLEPDTMAQQGTAPIARQRPGTVFRPSVALAASVALFIGISIGLGAGLFAPDSGRAQWRQVAEVLETRPSGISEQLGDSLEVRPRLTYVDRDGNYCRQFQLADDGSTEESVACRRGGAWQRVATIYLPGKTGGGEYQAASGVSPLDRILDQSIAAGPFDQEAESATIRGGWPVTKNQQPGTD